MYFKKIAEKINSWDGPVELLFDYQYPGVECVLTATSGGQVEFEANISLEDAMGLMGELERLSKSFPKKGENNETI